ncbi:magnesium transporter CorA family protein [Paenibacillus sp. sgz302251]|uniref:magnesium transporter CorA family protein n=1 Tax=Paenibacillus sp. sgz302251 TaxID=3414493 RepID=UPI003C7CC548
MSHRMLRFPAGWEWHVLQQDEPQTVKQESLPSRKEILNKSDDARGEMKALHAASSMKLAAVRLQENELKRLFPACASWIDECAGRHSNHISVGEGPDTEPLLYGTLMFQVTEEQSDVQPFHFWIEQKRLITMHHDIRLAVRLQAPQYTPKLNECSSAAEGFFVMLGIILDTFHAGLDGFEARLGELESTMRKENRTGLIDEIFERRYDLLHWSHLFIPVREVHGAAKEAFMEELTETDSFKRITHKLERIDELLRHYALEIDTLISMDDAISNFRGNDIMKTLTIFTVLFLPATVIGAIWGVNFEILPWKDNKWGFTSMTTGIFIITVIIYIWLWKKGWTGDLLNGRRPQEITNDNSKSRSKRSRSSKSSGRAKQATTRSSEETSSTEGRSRRYRSK